MKLVDGEYVTDGEQAMRATLEAQPALLHHLTWLVNSYRGLLHAALYGGDPADIVRTSAKRELAAQRIGIALWDLEEHS